MKKESSIEIKQLLLSLNGKGVPAKSGIAKNSFKETIKEIENKILGKQNFDIIIPKARIFIQITEEPRLEEEEDKKKPLILRYHSSEIIDDFDAVVAEIAEKYEERTRVAKKLGFGGSESEEEEVVEEEEKEEENEGDEEKKGFFARIFGKKEKQEEEGEEG